jgi:hypothetical protein
MKERVKSSWGMLNVCACVYVPLHGYICLPLVYVPSHSNSPMLRYLPKEFQMFSLAREEKNLSLLKCQTDSQVSPGSEQKIQRSRNTSIYSFFLQTHVTTFFYFPKCMKIAESCISSQCLQ